MRRFLPIGLILLAVVARPVWATTPEAAMQFIDKLSADALTVLSADGVALEEKETKVRALLAENFDLDVIGRYVLGPSWRTATPEQQEQYLGLFREYVVRTYARRLGGYTGQNFEITGSKPIGKQDVLVTSKITRPSGPPVEAGWRVREDGGRHKILDVVVSGVSMVVTQRSEFRAVVRQQGVEGLIEVLQLQVSRFAARAE